MSFLNAILAFGAFAFAVPLIIHLLFRSRFKVVDWGAMYLLTEAVVAKRRRFQLTDILLLLVRCSIPILLAICLARPVLTDWNALPGDAPQSFVVVIDDSRSMTATEPNDVVRFEKSKQQLTQFLSGQSRRDEVILVVASRENEVASKMGIHEATAKINDLVADSGPVDVGRMIKAGAEAASDASHPNRHVMIVSDFQSNIVDDAAIESTDATASAVRAQPIPPIFSFWNVSEQSDKLRNVSVDSVRVDAPAVVAERKTMFDAKIRNASDDAVRDVRVVWSVGDEAVQSATVNLDPRSSAIARATMEFERPGPQRVTVTIEHDDAMVADNRRSLKVDVLSQVNVLLVSGDPNTKPLQGETDYLAIALSPFSFNAGDRPDPIHTDIVSAKQFRRNIRENRNVLSDVHVVVLANIDKADAVFRAQLASYVAQGGALVVFDGERVDADSFNQDWEIENRSGESAMRLPAALGTVAGDGKERQETPFRIRSVNQQYLPWRSVVGEKQLPLRRIEIRAYRKLQIRDDAEHANLQTLLTLTNGDPLAVASSFGKGRIAQFAIPCDSDWSTLPLRPIFVPMMHQLVMDLAGKTQSQGDTLSEIPAAESELRDVNPKRLQSLAESLDGDVYTNVNALQSADQVRRYGREVWRWILAALLAIMVLELILQQRRVALSVPRVAT